MGPGIAPPMMGGPPGGGHATPQQAALIAHLLTHPGGGPPGAGADNAPKPNGHGLSPLDAVQSVITDLHDLMKILPDPGAVNVAATCLKAMTGLQQTLMKPQGGGQ